MRLKLKIKTLYIKFRYWEYWNSNLVYLPILPYLLYLMIKSRDFFFFIGANPGIENGGFILESKWKIQERFGQKYFPKTTLIKKNNDLKTLEIERNFTYPFIAKPDIGAKGVGVTLIHNLSELERYHQKCPLDYLIQEKIDLVYEIGLFYVKMPNEKEGKITGIVRKENIRIVGDGTSTILNLLKKNKRYLLQLKALKQIINHEILNKVLAKGELFLLLDIGNHSRGSLFLDASIQITNKLTYTFNEICNSFEGFYFGRLDIKFENWEELEIGENFVIIEVNGSGSEPTHIYDPKNKLFFAWKEIMKHWNMMMKISNQNSKKGIEKLSLKEGFRLFKRYKSFSSKLNTMKL